MLCVLVCLEYDYMTKCQWLWLLCEHLICMLWYGTWCMIQNDMCDYMIEHVKYDTWVWLHNVAIYGYIYYAYKEMHDIICWHDAIWLIYKRYMNKRYEHE